jgi:hypothetical protein
MMTRRRMLMAGTLMLTLACSYGCGNEKLHGTPEAGFKSAREDGQQDSKAEAESNGDEE